MKSILDRPYDPNRDIIKDGREKFGEEQFGSAYALIGNPLMAYDYLEHGPLEPSHCKRFRNVGKKVVERLQREGVVLGGERDATPSRRRELSEMSLADLEELRRKLLRDYTQLGVLIGMKSGAKYCERA